MPRTASTTPKTTAAKKPAAKKPEAPVTDPKEVLDFDQVAAGGTPDAPAVGDDDQEQTTEEHDNTDEVAELKAQVAELKAILQAQAQPKITGSGTSTWSTGTTVVTNAPAYEPVDESTLTPEQIQIRTLQDQLAKARGKDIEKGEDVYEENVEGGVLIHFLEDGLVANGRVFYRGQEVTFGPEAYADTLDRLGESWINTSESAQVARWGKIMFRKGPWPGQRKYDEEYLKNVSITEQAPLVRI